MSFTESAINALINPNSDGRQITITRMIVSPTVTDFFVQGCIEPYNAPASLQIVNTQTSAQAASAIQAAVLAI